MVKARLATFRGLVLLGAEMHPDARTLREAGVMRGDTEILREAIVWAAARSAGGA